MKRLSFSLVALTSLPVMVFLSVFAGCDADKPLNDGSSSTGGGGATSSSTGSNAGGGGSAEGGGGMGSSGPTVFQPPVEQKGCWTIERLTENDAAAFSAALDSTGRLHLGLLGYDDFTGNNDFTKKALYLEGVPGGYVPHAIGAVEPSFEHWIHLALDSKGAAHLTIPGLAFEQNQDSWVAYATNASGSWELTDLDPMYKYLYEAVPHVADDGTLTLLLSGWTTNMTNFDIQLLTMQRTTGQAWTTPTPVTDTISSHSRYEDLQLFALPGGFTAAARLGGLHEYYDPLQPMAQVAQSSLYGISSVDIDGAGYAWMAYVSATGPFFPNNYHIATNASGTWESTKILTIPEGEIFWTSLAVDSKGSAHMFAHDSKGCQYLTNESGSWVVSPFELACEPKLYIDAMDRKHLVWSWSDGVRHAVCNE